MKKTIALFIVSLIILLFNGCTDTKQNDINFVKNDEQISIEDSTTKKVDNTVDSKTNILEIGWEFETSIKEENGIEVPITNILLLIDGKSYDIGQYLGNAEDVSNVEGANMPKDSIIACKTWFGGAGEELYIKKGDDQTILVMSREVDEAGNKQEFKNIKEIKLNKNLQNIEIINVK
jgi:hypothetical protein